MRIDDVISAASEELNASYENNALWFEVLIHQAIRSHKTRDKFVEKNDKLKIYDYKVTLPKDWHKVLGIYLCNTTEKYCEGIDYNIQGDTVIFNPSKAITDGLEILVSYLGLRTDSEDNIVIPDNWERMLVAYIGWKYTRRYIKDFGMGVMQNYQREYQNQKLANI